MARAKNKTAAAATNIEWREVPSRRRDRQKSRVAAVVDQLKANPGRSARVVRNARSTSATATWKKYGCIAQIRQAEDDPSLYDVYAWWPAEGETDGQSEEES